MHAKTKKLENKPWNARHSIKSLDNIMLLLILHYIEGK
jgi:hypothetical protein